MNAPIQNDAMSSFPHPRGRFVSATDGDAAREWNLRGVLDLLRRQFKLIAATIVVIVGLAVVATLAITPIYSAATLVLVDPSRKNLLEPALQSVATSSDSASFSALDFASRRSPSSKP